MLFVFGMRHHSHKNDDSQRYLHVYVSINLIQEHTQTESVLFFRLSDVFHECEVTFIPTTNHEYLEYLNIH